MNPINPDGLVSLQVILTVFHHSYPLVDVVVRLGSLIDNILIKAHI